MLKGRNLYKGGCVVFVSVVSPCGLLRPACSGALSPISCRAVLLEQVCVSLGVRVWSAKRFHWIGFEKCALH